jgi:hypothetical protein
MKDTIIHVGQFILIMFVFALAHVGLLMFLVSKLKMDETVIHSGMVLCYIVIYGVVHYRLQR